MASFSYRPPWPDELPRASALLTQRQAFGPGWHPRVWEAPRPARFIGAAGWLLDEEKKFANIFFHLLPRYASGSLAVEMLRPLFAEVAASGATQAHVTVRDREKWEGLLGGFGLKWDRADEQWTIDSALARERLAASRLADHPEKLRGWKTRPLAEADWSLVKKWAVKTGFLSAQREEHLRAHHTPEISGVAESSRGVEGMLVAAQHGLSAVLEFIGGDPAHRAGWPVATHLLLRRLFASDSPVAPFDSLMMTTNPGKRAAAQALAKRFGMTLAAAHHHFRGEITV